MSTVLQTISVRWGRKKKIHFLVVEFNARFIKYKERKVLFHGTDDEQVDMAKC